MRFLDRLARLASIGLPGDEPELDFQALLADVPDADQNAILNDAALLLKKRIAEWLDAAEKPSDQGTGQTELRG